MKGSENAKVQLAYAVTRPRSKARRQQPQVRPDITSSVLAAQRRGVSEDRKDTGAQGRSQRTNDHKDRSVKARPSYNRAHLQPVRRGREEEPENFEESGCDYTGQAFILVESWMHTDREYTVNWNPLTGWSVCPF